MTRIRNINRFRFFLLITLILNACIGFSDNTALSTGAEFETATPTPVGSWETVIEGVIYDKSVGSDQPVSGATIRYVVVHSYFMELQQGRINKTETDEEGKFFLPVMVHDTDRVRILIEAKGFVPHEENLVGVDLFGGKNYMIGLSPLTKATEDSH